MPPAKAELQKALQEGEEDWKKRKKTRYMKLWFSSSSSNLPLLPAKLFCFLLLSLVVLCGTIDSLGMAAGCFAGRVYTSMLDARLGSRLGSRLASQNRT
jgi:hypothetical protein